MIPTKFGSNQNLPANPNDIEKKLVFIEGSWME